MSSTAIQNFPFLNVRPLEGNDYMYNNSSFQFFYITKGYVFISYINMVFKTSNSGWKISKPLQSPQAGVFNFLFFFWSEKHLCAWLWVLVESPCHVLKEAYFTCDWLWALVEFPGILKDAYFTQIRGILQQEDFSGGRKGTFGLQY